MFDSLLADGLGSGLAEKVAGYAIKCLAVAGGFLIGYFLGKAVGWGLDRWVFANKAPDQVKKAVAFLAGLALAILVAIIVFGEGGNGLFGGGGGDGQGKGQPTPADKGKAAPTPAPVEPKDVTPPPKKDETPKPPPKPTPEDMRIIILAGSDAKDGPDGKARLYLIDGDPVAKTFEEFKEAVNTRRKKTDPELKQVYYRFKDETLDAKQPAVQQVYLWLNTLKIGFTPE